LESDDLAETPRGDDAPLDDVVQFVTSMYIVHASDGKVELAQRGLRGGMG